MTDNNTDLRKKFKAYQENNIFDYLMFRILVVLVTISLLILNDIFLIHNKLSVLTRLPIAILIVLELLFYLFLKNRTKLLFHTYTIIISLIPVSMYVKIILHNGDSERVISSVVGAIVALFITSLELKVKRLNSILIFVLPYLIFITLVIITFDNQSDIHFITINMTTFILIAIASNFLKNKQDFALYKTTYQLKMERDKVQKLNKQTTSINKELKDINTTKNRFFSIIAHDLKAPFNTIIGYSNLLSEDYHLYTDEKRIKFIKEIETSANNTLDLLNNLLTWARSQQDGIELKKEKTNLFVFTDKVIELQIGTAKKKGISLINNVPATISINIDNSTFNTILLNLLNNAIKYTKHGGEVILNAKEFSSQIEITITDNGIGMTKDVVSNLFNMSINNSTTGTNLEKGTGLGLLLCKEFTDKNAGEIRVESIKGKGSTFYLTFPIYK